MNGRTWLLSALLVISNSSVLLLPEQLVSTTCPDHNNKLLHLKEWSPKRGYLFPSNMQSGFDLDLELFTLIPSRFELRKQTDFVRLYSIVNYFSLSFCQQDATNDDGCSDID